MTDHRLTDLSYGHLGESSYDIGQSQWEFSVKHTTGWSYRFSRKASIDGFLGPAFQQLLPFKQCEPPCDQKAPKTGQKSSNVVRAQMTALVRSRPEVFPAYNLASTLCRRNSSHQGLPITNSQLFSLGGAVDIEHLPGYRTIPIIAIPHGEAGHVLRLIQPSVERHGWQKYGSVTVPLMDTALSDHGHWTGFGGTIQQIVFADDGNVASTWLAVRQAFVTTIFRPMYNTSPAPAITPKSPGTPYYSSRLSANPVAILTAERTHSVRHVDVSFNPYYARQFAVVDDQGSWSIWNIEGRSRNRTTLELVPGTTGRIYDGYTQDPNVRDGLDNEDGWHRILWATNVCTLVLCNRRHIAIFDIQSTPKRLQGEQVLSVLSTDWIFDVKRSAVNLSHLFVLTSSRIFWLEIMAAGLDEDSDVGAKVLLSYRHFRDPNDETMKLTILKDDDGIRSINSTRRQLTIFSACPDFVKQDHSRQFLQLLHQSRRCRRNVFSGLVYPILDDRKSDFVNLSRFTVHPLSSSSPYPKYVSATRIRSRIH